MTPQPIEILVDEPVERVQASGGAAILYCEEDSTWGAVLNPAACRVMAQRLLELAAAHERRHGRAAAS